MLAAVPPGFVAAEFTIPPARRARVFRRTRTDPGLARPERFVDDFVFLNDISGLVVIVDQRGGAVLVCDLRRVGRGTSYNGDDLHHAGLGAGAPVSPTMI